MDYNQYYLNQAGGAYDIYRGPLYQKGYGLGGAFRRFFKWIIPLVQKHGAPIIEKGINTVGNQVVSSASDLAVDIIKGKDMKEAANEHFETAVENLKRKAEDALEGKGIKRGRKKKSYVILKKSTKNKSRKLDIFDE